MPTDVEIGEEIVETTPILSQNQRDDYQSTSTSSSPLSYPEEEGLELGEGEELEEEKEESEEKLEKEREKEEGLEFPHLDTTDADILAKKLIACNDNEDLEKLVLRRSLDISFHNTSADDQRAGPTVGVTSAVATATVTVTAMKTSISRGNGGEGGSGGGSRRRTKDDDRNLLQKMFTMISLAVLGLMLIFVVLQLSTVVIGPASEPVGPYKLIEIQEGEAFFNHYTFYSGTDSAGSKGYVDYVSRSQAAELNIANVTYEDVDSYPPATNASNNNWFRGKATDKKEPFVYMSTAPTAEGPRYSVRLEGLRRFNRGLFILDVRHMPAGCGTWPAFWLTDEANWPVNGEIDILEGVNQQSVAKTALHTTAGCKMNDVPLGVKTGGWDTAQGVPKKNGDIDMTIREARDCFVYDPHQWLNQGCVGQSDDEESLGIPLNKKGGGVFVLEWDPMNRFIKSWVFSPHTSVPDNLRESLESANNEDSGNKVRPDPRLWGLPYAYFPIGKGTECPANHFQNMRLIFNMALCGTVAGNRFFLDCPDLKKKYGTCDNYVKANTPEMNDVYWKIRGVYVYEREWQKSWPNN